MTDDLSHVWQRLAYKPANNVESQMLTAVGGALLQVRDLPPFAGHDTAEDIPGSVRVACLESFLINVRLLAEFLVKQPSRDFGARHFVPSWNPSPEEAARRLGDDWWELASKHVVHFSMDRLQEDLSSIEYADTSRAGLERMASDCLQVWNAFSAHWGIAIIPGRPT